jgi:phosphohistidine phosphatase SixA
MKAHTAFLSISLSLLLPVAMHAQSLHGEALVKALRQGGYVIVMRHTSSPREVPDKKTVNPDNTKPERQLDEEGRTTATAFGKALRDLKIPIGDVLSSPTYRALETIRYAQLASPRAVPELGDNGQSMQGGTEAQAVWLRNQVTQFPKGVNTILVTHFPNIRGAFPDLSEVADGEAIVFGPDGKGGATVVGRIKIEEWPGLRASSGPVTRPASRLAFVR